MISSGGIVEPAAVHINIVQNPRTTRIYLTTPSATSSTSSSSLGSVEPQPNLRITRCKERWAKICPTFTYLLLNVVWMTTGVAGIALGNLVNRRYFSILLITVFSVMIAIVYRFFYDLENMDITPDPAENSTFLGIGQTTPASRRSLPPSYSSIFNRTETPPPSYEQSLAMLKAKKDHLHSTTFTLTVGK